MASTEVYTTPAELRDHIEKSLGDKDTVLEMVIEAASRAIDNYCNRPDGFVALSVATARVYAGSGGGVQRIDEAVAVTLVEVKRSVDDSAYVSWAAADWLAFSGDVNSPNFNGTPYEFLMAAPGGTYTYFTGGATSGRSGFRPDVLSVRGAPTVRVTAKWGYAVDIPPAVRQACIIQAARLLKRGEGAYADATGSADFGELQFRRRLDPDAEFLLKNGRLIRPTVG